MKPWAKYEVGFIDHGKFKAINANAICLWLEGKNYADGNFTDGLLPDYEVKRWRFYSKKSVELLTTSCGTKPGTSDAYQPLWFVVEGFGYRMHDYLLHNPCREEALERIAKAEAEKEKDKQRKAKWRADQAAKRAAEPSASRPVDVPVVVPPDKRDMSSDVTPLSASRQKTEDRNQNSEPEKSVYVPHPRGGGVLAGSYPREHLSHVVCGRVCLLERQFAEFVGKFGGDEESAKVAVRTWAEGVLHEWAVPPKLNQPIGGNTFAWWNVRWEEWHGSVKAVSNYDAEVAAIIAKGPSKRP